MMVKIILKKIAFRKPPIIKPLTIVEVSKIIEALITKVNRPRVRKFIGRVKSSKIGLMTKLRRPSTKEIIKADQRLATSTPGIT